MADSCSFKFANSGFNEDKFTTLANIHLKNSTDIPPSMRTSSSTMTQSPSTDVMDANLTPSTPLSGYSNEEHNGNAQAPATPKALTASSGNPLYERNGGFTAPASISSNHLISRTPSQSPPKCGRPFPSKHGHKRTASGELKFPFHVSQTSPVKKHSRAISTDSSSDRIAEVY